MIHKLTRTTTRLLALLFAVFATTSAWAAVPTPTVVWDGDFSTTVSKTGTDGNSYVFSSLNGLSVNGDGNLVINTANAQGALIELPDTSKTAATVVIKYSNLAAETTGNATLANFQVFSGGTKYYIGSRTIGAGTLNLSGYFESNWYYFNDATYGHGSVPQVPTGSGYYVFAYDSSVGTYTYTGTALDSLSGGYNTQLKWGSYKIGQVYIGGGQNNNKAFCWKGSGTVIEKVAIFMGAAYTADDLAEYAFPTAGKYDRWSYADGNVLTWQTASDATGNNGDFIASNDATYDLFDVATGVDSGAPVSGGLDSNSRAYWKPFCFGQTEYVAPGNVLRLSGDFYKGVHGKFSPLTLGGLIVEPGATGYSFPSEGNRSAALGDPTGKVETWFDINEDFSIARTGGVAFMGAVNLDIASGKTFTIVSAKLMKEGEYNSSAPQLPSVKVKGGVLKMHGEGQLSVGTFTATDAALDYTDLAGRANTNPFVSGTLAINEGTKFILPEGATSPYKVATAISGTYPTSITIGDTMYAATVSAGENDGEIAWELNEYTIEEAGDGYALSTIFPDPASTAGYTLHVNADATLAVGTTEVKSIMFDVAEGKTLTLSGTSLTATTIYVTGKGTVKTTASGALQGTLKGDGTVLCTAKPTLGASNLVATDYEWGGVLWIKGVNIGGILPQDCAGVNSTIRLTGCTGYFNNADSLMTCAGTLDLQDDGDTKAFEVTNGFSTNGKSKFAKLTGSGTFVSNTGTSQRYIFTDPSEFKGVINIPSGKNTRVILGDSEDNAGNGTVYVVAGATVTNVAGKVWTVQGGLNVAGDFTVDNTCTLKFTSISGSLTIAADKTLTMNGATDSLNYGGSGTVNVYGTLNMNTTRWTIGSSNVINLYENGTISGTGEGTNGALDWYNPGTLNVYGTSTISANIRCRDSGNLSFNVVSGTCTFSGESYGAKPITKTGSGTLKIAYTGSSTYNLPSLGAGTIEFASGTWNLGSLRDLSGYTFTDGGNAVVKVAQTEAEYGKGLLEITSIDTSIEHVTVVKVDSTETTLDVSAGAASMGDGTAVVGGKACTYDWEFNGDLTSVGYSSNALSYDGFTADNSFDEGSRLYIRTHPYYNSNNLGLWTWADDWTVAIKCTVPTTTNGMVITFGNQGTACVGLATSENDGKVVLFKAGANGAAETISEMTVSGRSTAQHLYIFSKTSDGKMKVYCDDTLIDDKSVSGLGSLPGTLQVGSLHGGVDYINLNRPASDDPATIDFVQVYNYGITDAQRSALIANYAWVNPNQYTRTVSGDESLSASDAWTKPSDSSTVALPITDADAIVTTSSSSAALAVNADFEADTLTINSGADGAALRIKAGTGTLSAAKVVVNAPVTIEYGAVDFSGSVVTFGEGGSLTYDFSGVAINSRTTRLVAKLTGLVEAPADLSDSSTWPVQVITHSDAASLADYYESTFSYDTDASAYYYVCGPDHDWGSEVYYTGGYWSSDSGNTISVTNAAGVTTKVFAGDTVVIPAYYPNATTWSDNTLPANVTKIRVSKSKIKVCSGANSGDIFTDVTWTVDSGCVLWFGVDSKTTSLGAMTINGPGSVECGNITINGAMSGNAPVKILDSVTTRLTSTGSIASTHTISGNASALITCAAVPPAMTFASGWAGTVELPSFAAAGHLLNNYGVSGSKIKINGITSGYLDAQTHTVQPEIVLAGDFNITDMSQRNYTFSKFSGTGDILFTPGSSGIQLSALTITELAEGYSGTVANNMANTTLNIGTLALAGGTSVIGGTKILPTGGTGSISVGAVTVGGEAQSFDLCYESDGVYVAAAEYNSVKYYAVAAAIAEAGDANLADITLLNGCTTVPDGYCISNGNVAKAQASVTATDDSVTYHASMSDAYTQAGTYGYKYITILANMSFEPLQTVKYKIADGVTVTPLAASDEYDTPTQNDPDLNGAFTYAFPTKAITYTWGGGAITASWNQPQNWRYGEGTTASRYPTDGDSVVINTPVSITIGGAGASVNGIAIGAAVTLTATTAKTVTATDDGIVLTSAAATLTVTGVTLSPEPTTNVERSRVRSSTSDGTTTYRVEVTPGTIFSVY
jgi:hypothetical protein